MITVQVDPTGYCLFAFPSTQEVYIVDREVVLDGINATTGVLSVSKVPAFENGDNRSLHSTFRELRSAAGHGKAAFTGAEGS